MIINIKNKSDFITLDFNIKQIRYLKDFEKMGKIEFLNLSNDDIIGYNYLWENDKTLFLKTLKEDIKSFLNIDINLNNLEVLK